MRAARHGVFMTIGNRIRRARKEASLSQVELTKLCGWDHQSRVSMYERGEREPSLNDIKTLAKALGCSITWLVTGDAYYVGKTQTSSKTVPLISWVQAGEWQDTHDPYTPGDGDRLVPITVNASDRSFALTVRGDSMLPDFPEGSTIIVDPEKEAVNGSFVIVRLDDSQEATFKQLVCDAGNVYLKPLNPRYPIITINGSATICGVVRQMLVNFD